MLDTPLAGSGSLSSILSGQSSGSSSTRGSQLAAALNEEGSAVNANLYVLLRACDRQVNRSHRSRPSVSMLRAHLFRCRRHQELHCGDGLPHETSSEKLSDAKESCCVPFMVHHKQLLSVSAFCCALLHHAVLDGSRFFQTNGRYPGCFVDTVEDDMPLLKSIALQILSELGVSSAAVQDDVVGEMCRCAEFLGEAKRSHVHVSVL